MKIAKFEKWRAIKMIEHYVEHIIQGQPQEFNFTIKLILFFILSHSAISAGVAWTQNIRIVGHILNLTEIFE